MQTLTTSLRRKPGPQPKLGPKAKTQGYALYPHERAAVAWFATHRNAGSDSDALRQMIDIAMSLALGDDWAEKLDGEAA